MSVTVEHVIGPVGIPSGEVFGNPKILQDLVDTVLDDVLSVLDDLAESDTPARRRTLVRTVFAAVEAVTATLKTDCLARDLSHYSVEELAMLREDSYEIGPDGKAERRHKTIPPRENFRFAIRMYAKHAVAGSAAFALDVGGSGWPALRDSLKVRNRLTHLKRPDDLAVTDAELETLQQAVVWLLREVSRVLAHVGDLLEAVESRLSSRIEQLREDLQR